MKIIKFHIISIVLIVLMVVFGLATTIAEPFCTAEFKIINNSSRFLEVVIVWDNDDVTEILFKNGTTFIFNNHLCVCKMTDPNDYTKSVTILDADENVIKIFVQHDDTGKLLGLTWKRSNNVFTLNITSALLN